MRESQRNPMPSRTIKESHRPRVSDRTMHCHSCSGQLSGLLFQKTNRHRHNSEMEPQEGRTASPLYTPRQRPHSLRKTTHQTVGLNAETKEDRHRAKGGTFVLTFPLIGPFRFRDFPGPIQTGMVKLKGFRGLSGARTDANCCRARPQSRTKVHNTEYNRGIRADLTLSKPRLGY